MNGMLQNEWGLGTMAFWSYAVTVLSLSILFTWLFNNTRRSILAAILLHFLFNSTLNVVSPISDRVSLFVAGILGLVAVLLVIICGAKTLVHNKTLR